MLKKNLSEIGSFLKVNIASKAYPTSAAFDSRKVQKGGLFFALKGKRFDGHYFLEEVTKKGAIAAVVSKHYVGPNYGLILIPVEDVVKSLQALARLVHQEKSPYVLGVTGTVGKTTTKEFIAKLLEERYSIGKSIGSANSQVSLPLFLLNQVKPVEILILEMGMSLPGEIENLVNIAPPDFGVLTKVSLAHSENFESSDAIAAEKIELFQKAKVGLFNLETMHFSAVQQASVQKTFYSMTNARADYYLKQSQDGIEVIEKGKESLPITPPFHASHLLENMLCAIAVARMHRLNWEEIKRGIAKIKPYRHRFELINKKGILYIDDSYNASLASMIAALDNLPKGKKKIALLGDMKELGQFSLSCHEQVAYHALNKIDHLLCIGNEIDPMIQIFKQAGKIAEKFSSIEEAKNRIEELAKAGDVVLIKGANSLKLWNILD